MEEFDRHIKSKIDSLCEVQGVEFDEERVWKRIQSRSSGGFFYFIGSIVLLIGLIILLLPKNENQRIITEYNQVKESIPEVLIDSNIAITKEEFLSKNLKVEGTDSAIGLKRKSSEEPKNVMNPSASIHRTKKVSVQKQNTPRTELRSGSVNERKKEFSMSAGKDNQTIGITHLKKINNHFSLTYGIQFNRSFNQRVKSNEHGFRSFDINQIQIPIGVRHQFFNRERRFKPHLYAGFINSFLLPSDSRAIDYNLKFESGLVLDYRIFSTKDGKKGYLRFRLPIYNKNIINQGVYKPSLYDALKSRN